MRCFLCVKPKQMKNQVWESFEHSQKKITLMQRFKMTATICINARNEFCIKRMNHSIGTSGTWPNLIWKKINHFYHILKPKYMCYLFLIGLFLVVDGFSSYHNNTISLSRSQVFWYLFCRKVGNSGTCVNSLSCFRVRVSFLFTWRRR